MLRHTDSDELYVCKILKDHNELIYELLACYKAKIKRISSTLKLFKHLSKLLNCDSHFSALWLLYLKSDNLQC